MSDILDILLAANFWAAALRIATPLIFGVIGALDPFHPQVKFMDLRGRRGHRRHAAPEHGAPSPLTNR